MTFSTGLSEPFPLRTHRKGLFLCSELRSCLSQLLKINTKFDRQDNTDLAFKISKYEKKCNFSSRAVFPYILRQP